MKLLITGASGFLGHHFTNFFKNHSKISSVYTLSRRGNVTYNIDITDSNSVKSCLKECKPNIIIHLAANPLTKLDEINPTDIVKTNIVGTQNVLHYAPEGCRFLFASSIVVYGDLTNRFQENLLCKPTSVYGVTKLAGENLVQAYSSMGNVNGVSLRTCATVSGIKLTHGILKDFIEKSRSSDSIFTIFGDKPGTCKPYIHVEDVLSAFDNLIFQNSEITGPINVCPNDEISALEVANIVLDTINKTKNKEIKFLGEKTIWKGDNKILRASASNMEKLGWIRKYNTSKDAIKQAVLENIL